MFSLKKLLGPGLILAAAESAPEPQAWGRLIALGAVDGFGHLSHDGEAECLMSGAEGPSSLFNASSRFVSLLQNAVFGAKVKAGVKRKSLSSETLASLVGSLQALIELEGSVAARCLPHHALLRLRQASDALLMLQEQDGRLMLQQLEIQDDLDVACQDFKLEEYASFGRDLGQIWRRALDDASPREAQESVRVHESAGSTSLVEVAVVLKVTTAMLQSFFGRSGAGPQGRASEFLWEDPLLFNTCIAEMNELQALWQSIGAVLRSAAEQHQLWSFSTPDAKVRNREVQQLAHLGRILQQLPRILDGCGLQGKQQHMFQQSLSVFKSPPERTLSAAASSLFVLEEHWKAKAWQEVGSKLGLLMQDMLLDAFPDTVRLDSGRLRVLAPPHREGPNTHVIILCLCAGLAIPVTGFAAARGWTVPRIIRAMFEIRKIRCDDCEEGSGNAVEEIQIEFSARIRRLEMSGLLHSEEEETIEDFHESMKIPYSASRVKC